jgi:hypothetical protein
LTPAVQAIARTAYDDRVLPSSTLDNGLLGILADGLEDPSCTYQAILGHLRGTNPHVRGCHVLDAILGWEWYQGHHQISPIGLSIVIPWMIL